MGIDHLAGFELGDEDAEGAALEERPLHDGIDLLLKVFTRCPAWADNLPGNKGQQGDK